MRLLVQIGLVALGSALGGLTRWGVTTAAARWLGTAFPWGTFFINVSGSLVVGFFMIWTTERALLDPRWRLLVVIGFCGAFTTFSSYAFESMAYFEQGQWLMMIANIFTNNVLCLLAALAGMALARVR